MIKSTESLDQLLSFDPLDTAEKLTGVKSTSDPDNPATALGFYLMHGWSTKKNAALIACGDTTLLNKLDYYLGVIASIGFEKVLEDDFEGHGKPEKLFIFARRDGLLLRFDTFGSDHVNAAEAYYNWQPNEADGWPGLTSSGGFSRLTDRPVWIGHHDAREALLHKINSLESGGKFVCPWIERPFLWLLNYGEKGESDYQAINTARIGRLPEWVQAIVDGSGQEQNS